MQPEISGNLAKSNPVGNLRDALFVIEERGEINFF